MNHQQESLRILRHAGETSARKLNLGETALALAALEKADTRIESYRQHLSALTEMLRAEGPVFRLDDQLRLLRRVMVVQHKYQGDESYHEDQRASNLMDVIDRRRGSPVALGLLYLHVADVLGWAMTGVDLAGHFLLRLSARDGSIVIDPFRAAQTCQIEEVDPSVFEGEKEGGLTEFFEESRVIDIASEILRPLDKREVLLRLQHHVKRRQLAQDRVDAAITTLQGMILFAPRRDELWKELGYLQAERGHIRAAITALEVVRDLSEDPAPLQQTDGIIRELRWRLN